MRFALSSGRLVCALLALAALGDVAGCEAMNELPARETSSADADAGAGKQNGSQGSAQSGGAGLGADTDSTASADAQSRQQPKARAGHAAASGGSDAPPYIGDVPARAASSGDRPCGSSEFSVGPCGGRSATAPVAGSAGAATAPASTTDEKQSGQVEEPDTSDCRVVALPESVRATYRLDPFYQKYANAGGIPVLASGEPVDRTLELACMLVKEMVSERLDVQAALLASKVTFAILGSVERTTDIPEYRDLPDYYDTRSRGLGGHTGLCAEENIMCDRQHDPYRGQSVCVHEFAHTIAIYGLFTADGSFEGRLADAFRRARDAGLWPNTLAAQDAQEYWAEGVQAWYDSNLEADPPDGIHGPINTQTELEDHDRALFNLIDELLPQKTSWPDCYQQAP